MTTCPKCGRPIGETHGLWADQCQPSSMGSRGVCAYMARAYQRGLREGIALAKEHATIDWPDNGADHHIDWTAVDAALEAKCD